MKKTIVATFIAAVLTVSMLSGCGSSSKGYSSSTTVSNAAYGMASDTAYEEAEEGLWEEPAADEESASYNDSADTDAVDNYNDPDIQNADISQKLIVTYNIDLETTNYDEIMEKIRSSIAPVGGYVESENEYSYYGGRYDYLCIRIPKDKASAWLAGINDYGTITHRSQSQENVTLQYVDMESRIKSLRSEQDALLSLMDKAESMEDIINIRSQLTNVNYEIEYYESSLRSLSNRVDYTTISLSISEVVQETVVEEDLWSQIQYKFERSLIGLKSFFRNLVIGLLGNSIIIVIVVAIIAAIVLAIKKIVKKASSKRAAKKATKAAANALPANVENKDTTDQEN